jgi:ribosomal protein S12 methylthiotransferase RimO
MPSAVPAAPRRVALVTLGCARNEVDSEELAARLAGDGFELVPDAADADAVLVNTCGFIEAAKKESIDTLLAAADLRDEGGPHAVVAVGCLAQRYGAELAAALPEADAVLGFDDYPEIGARLRGVLAGRPHVPHAPGDRRLLLPVTPVARPAVAAERAEATRPVGPVGPASGPRVLRRRLAGGPTAPVKLASGCDRRCSFCAIPTFRGAFLSRPPEDVLAETAWLATQGVREVVLVSENSTSYGKDLGDVRLLDRLLPELAAVEGIARVRVSYLQPAETRPELLAVLAGTPGVAPYFDLSFQHASAPVLRRMRRFGSADEFLELLDRVRRLAPAAGIRSNVIVGFPGETEADLAELERFLTAARLDVVGVFGYSDEDGTAAAALDGKLDAREVAARVDRVGRLVEELTAQRAEDRVGEPLEVLVERLDADGAAEGRAAHQGPDVDGLTVLPGGAGHRVGDLVPAVVVGTEGVDLVAVPGAGGAV